MEEVKLTIEADGKVVLHFRGLKAEVRHSLAKELERRIGPASERRHGPGDEDLQGRMHLHARDDESPAPGS